MTFLQSLLYTTCLQRKLIQCVVYDTSGIVLVSNKSSKVYKYFLICCFSIRKDEMIYKWRKRTYNTMTNGKRHKD